jgi:hypothetical protein
MSIKKTVLIIALVLVGGTATYLASQEEPTVEVKQIEKMEESEQQAFLDTLLEKVSAGEKPSDVEAMLVEKIEGLSKDNASEGIYLLLSAMAVEQGNQMTNYLTVGEGVLSAYTDDQFKTGNKENYKKVEDKAVQGYLQELKRQHLFIEDDGEGLYLSQDLKEIEKEYEKYLNDSIKSVFEIRLMNQEQPYVDANKTVYDMDKMMEHILTVEGEKENWQGTIYEGEMLAMQEQSYMDFFGVTHDTYFDDKAGKLIMKESVIEKMYLLQAEYANSFMGEEIIGYMGELEADDFEKKDTQGFLYSRMIERFATESSEQTPIILNQDAGEGDAE